MMFAGRGIVDVNIFTKKKVGSDGFNAMFRGFCVSVLLLVSSRARLKVFRV